MSKTINSSRDQLTPKEQKIYKTNLKKAQSIRKDLKASLKSLRYGKVYTEARSGGGCRTKFWLVNQNTSKRISNYVKKHYPEVEVKVIKPSPFRWWLPGVSITVK
jgi:hypothetical protein